MHKLLILPTSVRPNSAGENVLALVLKETSSRSDIQTSVFDFRQNPLPFFDNPVVPSKPEYQVEDEHAKKLLNEILTAEYVLILAAEYNHGYTALIKNAIDHMPPSALENKKILFVGYGWGGAQRAIVKLRALFTEFIKASPSDKEANLCFNKEINLDGTVHDAEATRVAVAHVLDEISRE